MKKDTSVSFSLFNVNVKEKSNSLYKPANDPPQKVDRAKMAQTEFPIIEFEGDTFKLLLNYLHTGCCNLSCLNIPGLICAAEHYDLPGFTTKAIALRNIVLFSSILSSDRNFSAW